MTVAVERFGDVTVDVGYGGAFYAFVDAQRFGLDVAKSRTRDLVDAATAVTNAVKSQVRSSRDSEHRTKRNMKNTPRQKYLSVKRLSPEPLLISHCFGYFAVIPSKVKLHHPTSDDLAFLYGTILTDGKDQYSSDPSANICVFAEAQVFYRHWSREETHTLSFDTGIASKTWLN